MGRLARFIHFYTDEDDGADVGPTNIVSGNPPLALVNAIAKKIRRLTQIGKCTVSGTDITCNNGVLKYDSELGIYADGTPEEIRVTASGAEDQTATASNLFAVGSVKDEQDIISGTITRRCEAVVSDGTTPSGRYIGTVGEGNILVCAKETGYSGAIASFTADKAEPLSGLVAEINPVQDLHGEANPYPAGGGRNKFDPRRAVKGLGYNSSVGTTFTPATADKQWTDKGNGVFEIDNLGSWEQAGFYSDVLPSGSVWMSINNVTGNLKGTIYVCDENFTVNRVSAIGNPISEGATFFVQTTFSGTDARVVMYLAGNGEKAHIEKPCIYTGSDTSDTSYSPYSNLCPISGHTGVSGAVTGFNVWDEEWVNGRWAGNNGILNPAFYTYVACKNKIPVKPNTTYYLCVGSSVSTGREVVWYDINGDWIGDGPNSYVNGTFTTPSNVYFITFNLGGGYGATYNNDVSINYPSIDTSYHAYTGTPISVSWQDEAGTVYGGQDEVVGGELTSTMAMVDMGTLTWTRSSSFGGSFQAELVQMKENTAQSICSEYRIVSSGSEMTNADYAVYTKNNGKMIYAKDARYTDAASFKSAVSGVQLVYELATPQTYQLTSQEVDTLVGQNNVWVDTGDVTAYLPNFTTEKVSGQSLSTTDGTNTVFVTSNVDPVELEVEYRTP